MSDLYNTDLGGNTRRAIPTSRLGTRNLVWYSISVDYDLLRGEAGDDFTAYTSSDSLYHFIVEAIQEVAEIYHLGAPTNIIDNAFVFAIADNDEKEPDNNNDYFIVGYAIDPEKSSVYQALAQRLGGLPWTLEPCLDQGYGIISAGV